MGRWTGLLRILPKNENEIGKVYDFLADAKSRNVMRNLLQYKISRDPRLIEEIRDPVEWQYFDPNIVKLGSRENFLDLGAYIGDSITAFCQRVNGEYQSIIALEPSQRSYKRLLETTCYMQNVVCYSYGVGEKDGMMKFLEESTQTSMVSEAGTATIGIRSIDSLLPDKRISFIKADIEGMEKEMLRGAKCLIRKNIPILALSVYHKKEDIFQIPIMVKEMHPDYSIYMRHYTGSSVDTVLYAVDERGSFRNGAGRN